MSSTEGSWSLLSFRRSRETSSIGLAQIHDSSFLFRSSCLKVPLLTVCQVWVSARAPSKSSCVQISGFPLSTGEGCSCLVSAADSRAGLVLRGGLFAWSTLVGDFPLLGIISFHTKPLSIITNTLFFPSFTVIILLRYFRLIFWKDSKCIKSHPRTPLIIAASKF